MKTINIRERSHGVVFNGQEARISVWAPLIDEIIFVNETFGREVTLQKNDKGYHTSESVQVSEGDLYRFRIGQDLFPDPASLAQPFGVHESSQVINLSRYFWNDDRWHNPPLNEYIIYEVHVGTFTPEGNFDGIIKKLPYLKELGITAVEIMPVAQFPGDRNWGYDGVFPYAVQNTYGGALALQELVDTCHQEGIAVVLDVVYNHLGPEGNYLQHFAPFFTDKYKTPWGAAINYDDAYCDPVRQYFVENALMWLRDFHIDALRLDAVHAIKDFSAKNILEELADAVAIFNNTFNQSKYLIVESDLNDSKIIKSSNDGGYGIDAQWSDEFHHALRVALGQNPIGYYKDYEKLKDLAIAYKNAYVYMGQYSLVRQRHFGTNTKGIPSDKFIVFSQNHDQVGNRAWGERTAHLMNYEQLKLAAVAVLLSPFVPLLFMGEEWGASTPFLYFVDHSNHQLLSDIEAGRKKEFSYLHNEELPVAHHEETYLKSKLNWDELDFDTHKNLLQFYKKLIAYRKSNALFKIKNRDMIAVSVQAESSILHIDRTAENTQLVIIMNISDKSQTYTVNNLHPNATLLLDSAVEHAGSMVVGGQTGLFTYELRPYSAIIFTSDDVLS